MAENKTIIKKDPLKKRVSPDTLLQEFASGITLREIGKKYNCSYENIRLIIKKHDSELYIKIKESYHKNILAEKWEIFRQLITKLGYIPTKEETEKLMELPYPRFYFQLIRLTVRKGFKTKFKYEKEERYSRKREILLAYLKETAIRLGRMPTFSDLAAEGKYYGATYRFYFGNLSVAQQLAFNSFNKRGNTSELARLRPTKLSRNQCVEDLVNLRNQLGHKPTWKEVEAYGTHHKGTYRQKIGDSITDYVDFKKGGRQKLSFQKSENKMMLS